MRALGYIALGVATAAWTSCSDPSGPPLTSIDQLIGNWVADEYVVIDSADPEKTRDMLDGSITWDTMVVGQGGAAIINYGNAGVAFADTALLGLSNGILTWATLRGGTTFGQPYEYDFTGAGDHMSWLSRFISSVDVDGDGIRDPVYTRTKWRRLSAP